MRNLGLRIQKLGEIRQELARHIEIAYFYSVLERASSRARFFELEEQKTEKNLKNTINIDVFVFVPVLVPVLDFPCQFKVSGL